MPLSAAGSRMSNLSNASKISSRSVTSVESLTTTFETKTGIRIPILADAFVTDIQRGSLLAATLSVIEGLFAVVTGIFDIHSLVLAAPGSEHFGYYLFPYDFVYVGNPHVRNTLILFDVITIIGGVALLICSFMLLQGLRREAEIRMEPWIYCIAIFTVYRAVVLIYFCIINDMIFAYHIIMCIFWSIFIIANAIGLLVVHSFYRELCRLTRLEDCARIKLETQSTLGYSSRPTTPGANSSVSSTLMP